MTMPTTIADVRQGAAETGYVRPRALADALAARHEHPQWAVLAGGTDLMVGDRLRGAPGVIDLFGLAELTGVADEPGGFRIGAGTTFAELARHASLVAACPLLAEAARSVGAVQIAERGTIGGNVMTASPAGDLWPPLLALDAVAELCSVGGDRRIAMTEMSTGYRRTACRDDELLIALMVPRPAADTIQRWRKVGTRQAHAISVVSLAATAQLDHDVVTRCTLALGAVDDRAIRLPEVERLIVGRHPDGPLADEVAAAVADLVHPIDDVRATASYRRATASRLVARFVRDLTGCDAASQC